MKHWLGCLPSVQYRTAWVKSKARVLPALGPWASKTAVQSASSPQDRPAYSFQNWSRAYSNTFTSYSFHGRLQGSATNIVGLVDQLLPMSTARTTSSLAARTSAPRGM